MEEVWVREIKNQCDVAAVPFFFKQWGGVSKKKTGREFDGRTWDGFPVPTTRPVQAVLPL